MFREQKQRADWSRLTRMRAPSDLVDWLIWLVAQNPQHLVVVPFMASQPVVISVCARFIVSNLNCIRPEFQWEIFFTFSWYAWLCQKNQIHITTKYTDQQTIYKFSDSVKNYLWPDYFTDLCCHVSYLDHFGVTWEMNRFKINSYGSLLNEWRCCHCHRRWM